MLVRMREYAVSYARSHFVYYKLEHLFRLADFFFDDPPRTDALAGKWVLTDYNGTESCREVIKEVEERLKGAPAIIERATRPRTSPAYFAAPRTRTDNNVDEDELQAAYSALMDGEPHARDRLYLELLPLIETRAQGKEKKGRFWGKIEKDRSEDKEGDKKKKDRYGWREGVKLDAGDLAPEAAVAVLEEIDRMAAKPRKEHESLKKYFSKLIKHAMNGFISGGKRTFKPEDAKEIEAAAEREGRELTADEKAKIKELADATAVIGGSAIYKPTEQRRLEREIREIRKKMEHKRGRLLDLTQLAEDPDLTEDEKRKLARFVLTEVRSLTKQREDEKDFDIADKPNEYGGELTPLDIAECRATCEQVCRDETESKAIAARFDNLIETTDGVATITKAETAKRVGVAQSTVSERLAAIKARLLKAETDPDPDLDLDPAAVIPRAPAAVPATPAVSAA